MTASRKNIVRRRARSAKPRDASLEVPRDTASERRLFPQPALDTPRDDAAQTLTPKTPAPIRSQEIGLIRGTYDPTYTYRVIRKIQNEECALPPRVVIEAMMRVYNGGRMPPIANKDVDRMSVLWEKFAKKLMEYNTDKNKEGDERPDFREMLEHDGAASLCVGRIAYDVLDHWVAFPTDPEKMQPGSVVDDTPDDFIVNLIEKLYTDESPISELVPESDTPEDSDGTTPPCLVSDSDDSDYEKDDENDAVNTEETASVASMEDPVSVSKPEEESAKADDAGVSESPSTVKRTKDPLEIEKHVIVMRRVQVATPLEDIVTLFSVVVRNIPEKKLGMMRALTSIILSDGFSKIVDEVVSAPEPPFQFLNGWSCESVVWSATKALMISSSVVEEPSISEDDVTQTVHFLITTNDRSCKEIDPAEFHRALCQLYAPQSIRFQG